MKLNLNRPDVYFDRDNSDLSYSGVNTPFLSVPVFIGKCPRGKINEPVNIYGWEDYKKKTSLGLESPFMTNGELPYVVWDFYKNGGENAYFIRVVGENAKYSEIQVPESTGVKFKAKDIGSWANDKVKISVVSVEEDNKFTIKVLLNDEEVETFINLEEKESERNYKYVINKYSNYIAIDPTDKGKLAKGEGTLKGGTDDLESITIKDYEKALNLLDTHNDFGLVSLVEQSNLEAYKLITKYCEDRGDCIPIMCSALGSSVDTMIQNVKELSKIIGTVYYPQIKVIDPASPTEQIRVINPVGGICGNIVKTDKLRGTHKAPAGINCRLENAIGVETPLVINAKKDEVATLLNANINPIIVRPNRGVIIWGASSLTGRPISNERLERDIERQCYSNTEWSIFEPSSLDLCDQVKVSLEDTLRNFYNKGAFKGKDEKSSFIVKCDEELNPQEELDKGIVRAKIGFADKKPNKFTIITIQRHCNSN